MTLQQARGTVYGVILNDAISRERIGSLDDAPYKGAPKAPVLYIKPANTRATAGAAIALPEGASSVEVGATIGLVIAQPAARVAPESALSHVGALVLAADLSLPHASYYRPAIREKCFDQSLVLGAPQPLCDMAALALETSIDGQSAERFALSELLRGPAQLLSEVSSWMTLCPGDVLLVGVRYQAPQARAGQHIRIDAGALGALQFEIKQGGQA